MQTIIDKYIYEDKYMYIKCKVDNRWVNWWLTKILKGNVEQIHIYVKANTYMETKGQSKYIYEDTYIRDKYIALES